MTCRSLFEGATKHRKELDAPIRIFPRCHPKAYLEVFVDSKKGTVILCCSACDRLVETIKAKGVGNGNVDPSTAKGA